MTDPSRPQSETEHMGGGRALDQTIVRGAPPAADPEPTFAPPKHAGEVGTFGRYRVLKKLGQGGMGAVYLAYDGALERKVALKVMLPRLAADAEARERFLREARSAAKVKSDHVVTIFDVGEAGGTPFIAMEYLLGYTLDKYLDVAGELPLAQVLRVGRETAQGLAAAHYLGLIHRDIKPENLWLEAPEGRVKLLDFGLARATNDTRLTHDGTMVGTPAYMSPEQARGRAVDYRSDLFSLGVILYWLATGRMPFTGPDTMAILSSLALDTPTPAAELNPQLPAVLAAIIDRLLAKKPADRFSSAADLADALRAVEHPPADGRPPLVVVPLAVAAQPQSVWDGIEDFGSVAVPLASDPGADTAVMPVPPPKPPRRQPVRKPSKRPALLAGVALLVACAVLAAVILKPWKKEPVAQNDGGEKAPPAPGVKPPVVKPPAAADPDRKAAEYVLSVGGAVQVNGESHEIKTVAALPKDRFALTGVNFTSENPVTNLGLANFRGCEHLTSLHLHSAEVGDAGLAHFKECKKLTYLALVEMRVTDAGLGHFKGCADLAVLNLYRTPTGDAGLAHFKECKNLTTLNLGGATVTDAALAHLKGHQNLRHLDLGQSVVTDAGLAHLKDCKGLTELGLYSTPTTDVGLAHLRDCRGLTSLSVEGARVTAAAVAAFSEAMPQCKITHDGGTIEPKKK